MITPDGELVPPMAFLAAAERYDLTARLDRWVIDHAFAIIRKTQHADRVLQYSINLSGQTIGDPSLAEYVIDRLKVHGLDPRLIIFEITETAAIANLRHALVFIETLRALGCRFALDDFRQRP